MKTYTVKKFSIIFLLGLLTLGCIFLFDKGMAVGLGLVCVLSVGTFFVLWKSNVRGKKVYALFVLALLIHIAAALFIYIFDFQPFSGGAGDYLGYHNIAEEAANQIRRGHLSYGYDSYYPLIIALVYALTTPLMIVGQLFNVWLAALAVLLVYFISCEIGGSKQMAFTAGIVASIYPSFVFYTSLLLKDVVVILAALASLFLVLKIVKHFSWKYILLFFACLLITNHFRFYMGIVLAMVLACSLVFLSLEPLKRRIIYAVVAIPLLGLVPFITGEGYFWIDSFREYSSPTIIAFYKETAQSSEYRGAGQKSIEETLEKEKETEQPSQAAGKQPVTPQKEAPQTAQEEISQTITVKEEAIPKEEKTEQKEVIGAGSSFDVKLDFKNPLLFVRNLAISFLYVLGGPFPWQLKYQKHLFVLLETIPWYIMLFFAMKGAICSRNQYRLTLPLLLFAFVAMGVLALFLSNFGLITRIRIPAFLALICFIPMAFANGFPSQIKNKLESVVNVWLKHG